MNAPLRFTLAITLAACIALPCVSQGADVPKPKELARGRYLVVTSGCNDCHTAGYAPKDGNVPEKDWLKGDILGWRGPWGTTYPANLRLYMEKMTEDQWAKLGKVFRTQPPMPWYNVNAMTESDLRAIYKYVRSLGPAGDPAPAYLPPDKEPKPPFVQFPAPPK
jgi:mono/diheme cytochrome c family protein